MNKSGIGVGSASIVLVFAVLCLSVFTLITLSSAISDRAMAQASSEMISGYYEADVMAECVLAEILEAEYIPEVVRGVSVTSYTDLDTFTDIASFACPVSDSKELYVEVSLHGDGYDILKWKMRNISEWEMTDDITVWPGAEFELWSGE